MTNDIQKIPPKGAKYYIIYKLAIKPLIINSYNENYLYEVLHKYITKYDRHKVIFIQYKNRPICVVVRTYLQDKTNYITDYIEIITEQDTFIPKNELLTYIKEKNYIEVNTI